MQRATPPAGLVLTSREAKPHHEPWSCSAHFSSARKKTTLPAGAYGTTGTVGGSGENASPLKSARIGGAATSGTAQCPTSLPNNEPVRVGKLVVGARE